MPCRADGLGTGAGPMTEADYLAMETRSLRDRVDKLEKDPIREEFITVVNLYNKVLSKYKRKQDMRMRKWYDVVLRYRTAKDPFNVRMETLNVATRLLCEFMRGNTTSNRLNDLKNVKGLRDWWKKHQEVDRINSLRESALKKLTLEERKALGL